MSDDPTTLGHALARSFVRCALGATLAGAQAATQALAGAPRRRVARELDELATTAEREMAEPVAAAARTARFFQDGLIGTLAEIGSGRFLRGERASSPAWRELARPWTTHAATPPKTGLR